MSQSLLFHAFGVCEGYEYWKTEYGEGCVQFFLTVKPERLVCPQCQSQEVSRKGRRFRQLQTVPIGLKPVPGRHRGAQVPVSCVRPPFRGGPPLARPMSTTRNGSKRSSRISTR